MDDCQSAPPVNTRLTRRTYLLTYSYADIDMFFTRTEFDKCIKNALILF